MLKNIFERLGGRSNPELSDAQIAALTFAGMMLDDEREGKPANPVVLNALTKAMDVVLAERKKATQS